MALGDVKSLANALRKVCILFNASGTNGQPSLATDGVPYYPAAQTANIAADDGVCFTTKASREASILIAGTGTGTVSGTFRLWGYNTELAQWVPVGAGNDSTKGILNQNTAIGEVKTDTILHSEPLYLAGHFDRLYLEVTAVTGSGLSITAWIVTPRTVNF